MNLALEYEFLLIKVELILLNEHFLFQVFRETLFKLKKKLNQN